MEKNMKKRMSLGVKLSRFAVGQRLPQRCKSTILQLKQKEKKEKNTKKQTRSVERHRVLKELAALSLDMLSKPLPK